MSLTQPTLGCAGTRDRPRPALLRRRGITVLLVLLLLSVTLGLSYAMVRAQYTAFQIARNSDRRSLARQAAIAGLNLALKKMHTSSWAGVGTALSGNLSGFESYQVTYTAGDASLTAGSPDYADNPYRVTLLSTGSAADPAYPGDSSRVAKHTIRMVVHLVPRSLGSLPTDWPTMQQYTICQSKKSEFYVNIPFRATGPVRAQGRLDVAETYPNDTNAWQRYLGDLNQMRLHLGTDYRPFNGPLYLPFSDQDAYKFSVVTGAMGVPANDTPTQQVGSDFAPPTSVTTYRIYAGGPVYTAGTVDTNVTGNVTLGPDPATNPLGVYYCNVDDFSITGQQVTVRGSLYCKNQIKVAGPNVRFEPVELPALNRASGSVRLPVLSCNNFTLQPSGGGSLTGLLAVFSAFLIEKSPDTVAFAITGRVIADKFQVQERQPWETLHWNDLYDQFIFQLFDYYGPPPVPYFPVWLGGRGQNPQPLLTIKPDSTPVAYHWYNWSDPVFVPAQGDNGLRWEVLQWTDNP